MSRSCLGGVGVIEACDCAPMIWFWAPHLCAGLKTAAANLRWCFFGSIKSPRHVNSFTATCALPVHNVIAEGTRHDPTDETHTHMADDRRAGDRHIVGNYRDRYRDRDCSLAPLLHREHKDADRDVATVLGSNPDPDTDPDNCQR